MAELKSDKSWILNIIAEYSPILRKTLGLDLWNVHYLKPPYRDFLLFIVENIIANILTNK